MGCLFLCPLKWGACLQTNATLLLPPPPQDSDLVLSEILIRLVPRTNILRKIQVILIISQVWELQELAVTELT